MKLSVLNLTKHSCLWGVFLSAITAAASRSPGILRGVPSTTEPQMENFQLDVNTAVSEIFGVTLFRDMAPFDAWVLGKAYTQDTERASLIAAAQVAVYCWQHALDEDHSGAEKFIASSLYRLWSSDREAKLVTGMSDDEPRRPGVQFLLYAYTFQYGSSRKEMREWLENVGTRVSSRHAWAVFAVEEILDRNAGHRTDIPHLIRITRNMYHLRNGDIDAFREWWEKVKDRRRIEWAKDLVDTSLAELEHPKESIMTLAALRQLEMLLPQEVFSLEALAKTEDREQYAEYIASVRKWWEKHKTENFIPIDSQFAY